MKRLPKFLLPLFFAATIASAVPTEINYQGRLTDGDGNPASGSKVFSLSIFDADTGGNELYSETIGSVLVDNNGIYNFQFGANGSSVVTTDEVVAATDGSSTTFGGSLAQTPIAGTLSVADGTYSWNEQDGNPGEQATTSSVITSGFITGITVTNGGSGYTDPPTVVITGDGSGATATAVVSSGSVSAININNAGSGYTAATVSIAEPPAPFVVDYNGGNLTFTYDSIPVSGTKIIASYQASGSSLQGALRQADSQWLELSVDGQTQAPRERILTVPFAQVASFSQQVDESSLDVPTETLVSMIINRKEHEQNSLYYLTNSEIESDGTASPLPLVEAETNMEFSSGSYYPQASLEDDGFSVSRGQSSSRTFELPYSYVWSAQCFYNQSPNGGDITITYYYEDGTTSSQSRVLGFGSQGDFKFTNPNSTKRVTSVKYSLTAGGGAYLAGASVSTLKIVYQNASKLAFDLPEIESHYTKAMFTLLGTRVAGDDTILTNLTDSTGRGIILNGAENSLIKLNRYAGEGPLTLTFTCLPGPGNSHYSGCKVLFVP